jgi:iron(III) transport system ATP-binding protein
VRGSEPLSAEPVVVTGLVKSFAAAPVLRGVHLTAPAGSVVALLGPSGCGKTTLLRAIAGLEHAEQGEVRVSDRLLTGPGRFVPAERRRIGMVFQEATLFPHLTVARNVGYGLSRRDPHRRARVSEALTLVGLAGFEERSPSTLSGGQAQRVAIARALAPRPSVVLLDEPFSSLDAPLRAELRREVRRMLTTIEATAVFVTHDQEEAFVVGDEVAVMSEGRVLQQDTPSALYDRPTSRTVAEFVGDANFIAGRARGDEADTAIGTVPLATSLDGPVEVMVRPERLVVTAGDAGTVMAIEYFGHDAVYRVSMDRGPAVRARVIGSSDFRAGDRETLAFSGPAAMAYAATAPPLAADCIGVA